MNQKQKKSTKPVVLGHLHGGTSLALVTLYKTTEKKEPVMTPVISPIQTPYSPIVPSSTPSTQPPPSSATHPAGASQAQTPPELPLAPCWVKINDPSGETRVIQVRGKMTLGRHPDASIRLKDPTLGQYVGVISPVTDPLVRYSPGFMRPQPPLTPNLNPRLQSIGIASAPRYWLKMLQDCPPARLGDLQVRETCLPFETKVSIGDSSFELMRQKPFSTHRPSPPMPKGVKPWLTQSETGSELLVMSRKTAQTLLSVYLHGETGTGKEVIAHLLHAWSPRSAGPFVPIHCGALPLSLAESELFGHAKGAFTGAVNQRAGALTQAHGGTLFLDEVGELPLDIQVKLLRFLENGEIRPVGADHITHANVRLICATHHSLQDLVKQGKFRQDLYYRLASLTLSIPTLRSRPKDIELLATQFASKLGRSLSDQALLRLQAYGWPGNVRELRHAIERAVGLSGPFEPVIGEAAFEFLKCVDEFTPFSGDSTPALLTLKESERAVLLKALRLSGGNRARAAKIMGVARSTVFEMLKRHQIQGPRTPI